MDAITKNRSLVSIIIFLLITNLAMLVFFLVLNSPAQKNARGRDPNGISNLLQKEVGFSKEQLDKYQSLRKDHMDTAHRLFEELRKAKTDFYNMIYSPVASDTSIEKAAGLIAEKQKTLDMHMFKHFEQVRNICTPDQLQRFDTTIIKRVIARMTARPGHDH